MFRNKADNFIFPTHKDLKADNIVMIHHVYYRLLGVTPDFAALKPLLTKAEPQQYSMELVRGLNPAKYWFDENSIVWAQIVIDALLLFNGFEKYNYGFCYRVFRKDKLDIHAQGNQWRIEHNNAVHFISYVHDMQNLVESLIGYKWKLDGCF